MENDVHYTAVLYIDPSVSLEGIASASREKANQLIEQAYTNFSVAEHEFRAALKELLNCFWFYKKDRVVIAADMHKVGLLLHSNFGCTLDFDGEFYCHTCPNILLHKDFGFSGRAISKYGCSICKKPVLDCLHISQKEYDVACKRTEASCNICESLDNVQECNHQNGINYKIKCRQIHTELDIITFDLVKEPELVYTRITKIPISKDLIQKQIEKENVTDFVYGETKIHCHHCFDCAGYDPEENNFPSS